MALPRADRATAPRASGQLAAGHLPRNRRRSRCTVGPWTDCRGSLGAAQSHPASGPGHDCCGRTDGSSRKPGLHLPQLPQIGGPIFPMPVPLVAAIRSLRGAHRARLLVIIWLWAAGLMSVPFATDAQALGIVDAAVGCVGCAAANLAAAPPYPDKRDNGYTGGPLAYATPGNDVVARTENAITINDALPLEAPTQIRLHPLLTVL